MSTWERVPLSIRVFDVVESADFLGVSRDRVYELMELKKLERYEFLGRVYLSFTELAARRAADVRAGRPARNFAQRVKVGLKAVAHMIHCKLSTRDGWSRPSAERRKRRRNNYRGVMCFGSRGIVGIQKLGDPKFPSRLLLTDRGLVFLACLLGADFTGTSRVHTDPDAAFGGFARKLSSCRIPNFTHQKWELSRL